MFLISIVSGHTFLSPRLFFSLFVVTPYCAQRLFPVQCPGMVLKGQCMARDGAQAMLEEVTPFLSFRSVC